MASTPVLAAQQCDNRDSILDTLASKYSEAPIAIGVTNNGGLVEILTTGDGKTWTLIMSSPKGQTCLVAAGQGWKKLQEAKSSKIDPIDEPDA
jgi:hypothetical protein